MTDFKLIFKDGNGISDTMDQILKDREIATTM